MAPAGDWGASPDFPGPDLDPTPPSGDSGPVGAAPEPPVEQTPPPPPPDPRARDIRITEVALYQAVKVPLVQDGQAVIERNAPVIVGKEAFVRVYVEPLSDFTPREIEAELTLLSAESAAEPLRVQQRVSGESDEASLESTINFDVPAGSITEDVQWAVTLRELDPAQATGTIDDGARYPAEEDALEPLSPRNAGPLRVMLVPYRYQGDGSGRLPDLSDEQLDLYRSYIYAYYPISEIEFEMHDPVDYSRQIGPNSGWQTWLDSHCQLRNRESPDPKILYYGLIAPRASARQYGGGVAGISFLPGPAANYGRCSVGLGFEGGQSGFIMAHELGHSLGLPHAPCGVRGGPFPYDEAKIGSWGFGLSSRTLKEPDEHYDMMSYCNPAFISDFNFQKLFERVRYLNLQFGRVPGRAQSKAYLRILQRDDGGREVVGRQLFDEPPGGEEERRQVRLFDADGVAIDSDSDSYFLPMSEGDAGVWFVPDVGASTVAFDTSERMTL
ncbi:MAG: M66 family metalloprotease [Myxococcales bacterium]|nr:M66 family metalloprotease [Myxococcales bacterium]